MHSAPREAIPVETFLVEGYWPLTTVDAFPTAASRLDESLDGLRQEGVAVRAISALVVPGDETAYWIVDGPSAEAVSLACRRAGLTVERIVPALELRRGRPDSNAFVTYP
jgi:hypothetical protein